jgi:hypothetical protein
MKNDLGHRLKSHREALRMFILCAYPSASASQRRKDDPKHHDTIDNHPPEMVLNSNGSPGDVCFRLMKLSPRSARPVLLVDVLIQVGRFSS